jgi:glycosyltransferase involved in cell wall biosynthesis
VARFGRRIRRSCFAADAILAASETLVQELLQAGYAAERIHRIPYGAGGIPDKSAALRVQARAALAEINHDLETADYAPVAVCLRRLEDRKGLFDLVSAWRTVAQRWPAAKLWLIGDGPLRAALYERIVDLGLHHQILMPGSFDDLQEMFLAADVFVAPSPVPGGSPFLVSALIAGLPVVAISMPDTRDLIEDGVHGLLVPVGDCRALAGAISRLFETPPLAARLGNAARRRTQRNHSLERVATRHLELFSELVAARQRGSA